VHPPRARANWFCEIVVVVTLRAELGRGTDREAAPAGADLEQAVARAAGRRGGTGRRNFACCASASDWPSCSNHADE
jgi:hypothetical protein